MAEQYIYLGLSSNVHFFLHTQYSVDKDTSIMQSGDVYNMMIFKKDIKDQQHLIIYHIMLNNDIFATHVKHVTFNNIYFSNEVLNEMFTKLIKAERSNTWVITHEGGLCYEKFIDKDLISTNEQIKMKVNEIFDLISIKPLE